MPPRITECKLNSVSESSRLERRWKLFVVPQKLLASTATLSSRLSSLPVEVLVEIFHHADPIDKLSLAFTCKYFIQIAKTASIMAHASVGHNCEIMEQQLRNFTSLERPGEKPRKTWGICYTCQKFRPEETSHWMEKARKWVTEHDWEDDWSDFIGKWSDGRVAQCPECYRKSEFKRHRYCKRFEESYEDHAEWEERRQYYERWN